VWGVGGKKGALVPHARRRLPVEGGQVMKIFLQMVDGGLLNLDHVVVVGRVGDKVSALMSTGRLHALANFKDEEELVKKLRGIGTMVQVL
jgi:hypothetical protein